MNVYPAPKDARGPTLLNGDSAFMKDNSLAIRAQMRFRAAPMAWLGGRSLGAKGFGVAGGWVVLTGGDAMVVLGVTAAVVYGFHLEDEHQESVRLAKTIAYLSAKHTLFIPDSPRDVQRIQ